MAWVADAAAVAAAVVVVAAAVVVVVVVVAAAAVAVAAAAAVAHMRPAAVAPDAAGFAGTGRSDNEAGLGLSGTLDDGRNCSHGGALRLLGI